MQRTMAATLASLILLAVSVALSVQAQERTQRVFIDVELWTGGREMRQCLVLPPGELTITASVTRSMLLPSTVTLSMVSLMGTLGGEAFEMLVNTEPTVMSTRIKGGPYCWSVDANPFAFNDGLPFVAVKMVHVAQ